MLYPALEISGVPDGELLLAIADDFSPSALDDRGSTLTIYFIDAARREGARQAIARQWPDATISARDVDDEDWARRSQENLGPITVGRITVCPPWVQTVDAPHTATHVPRSKPRVPSLGSRDSIPEPRLPSPDSPLPTSDSRVQIVIAPSMGFGTGHHVTTRLCLAALQRTPVEGALALDVGTGSGVLALAARLLGAREAIGLDVDPDAIQSATENLALNPRVDAVRFLIGDLRDLPLPRAAVVTANLTGALLVQSAPLLAATLAPGGTLIVSGLMAAERDEVVTAFPTLGLKDEAAEDGWLGLTFNRGTATSG